MPEIADPRYQELRQLARRLLASSRRLDDPEPTELVHECFLRLARHEGWLHLSDNERRAYAARSLRNTLVDLRRAASAAKRGGYVSRLTLDEQEVSVDDSRAIDLLDLSEALEALALEYPHHAHVVELRYFGGLDLSAVGELLGTTPRSVSSDWNFARAWLHRRLSDSGVRGDALPGGAAHGQVPEGDDQRPPQGPADPLAPPQ